MNWSLIALLIVLALVTLWLSANYAGWYYVCHKPAGAPFNWRFALGPNAYLTWLHKDCPHCKEER